MISVLCPSRGRPQEAAALLESFRATKATAAQIAFLVDDDDPTREQYPVTTVGQLTIVGAPTGDPTGPLNRDAMRCEDGIIAFTGDDSRFETPGWDVQVERALDRPGFCWGMDGTSGHPWPSTIFVSREIVQRLGWLALPTLRRGFFDVVWVELARHTETARLVPDVMIRHDNSAGDPASANYIPERRVPPGIIAADEQAYRAWRSGPDFVRDCNKVLFASDLARFF